MKQKTGTNHTLETIIHKVDYWRSWKENMELRINLYKE